jgi:catechol 2,3-dioxygenase-like lactoylglutathione lyase family enzyme
MAEVLLQFDSRVTGVDGRPYLAQVCGRVADDGLWEAWLEFDPEDGGAVLRTPRETEQPNRRDLEYWATGLTVGYLEGALARARRAGLPDLRPRTVAAASAHEGPAPRRPAPRYAGPHAVLDPFHVYVQGEDILRDELKALNEDHLRNILRAYALADTTDPGVRTKTRGELAELIVTSVRNRMES